MKKSLLPERLQHVGMFLARNHPGGREIPRMKPKAFVYVIRCRQFIKIGIAEHPKERLAAMQTGNPFKLELLTQLKSSTPEIHEEELHSLLGKHHVRGEWFRLTKSIRLLLKQFKR